MYWAIIGLLLTLAGLTLKFVVVGTTETAADGSETIILAPSERAFVLNEMRQFLAGSNSCSKPPIAAVPRRS